jgi:predicted GNAT family acetyltransferase
LRPTGTALTLERHRDAESFLQAAESWLLAAEAENNLLLGIALGAKGRAADGPLRPYWATVRRESQVVGCACRTPPYRLVLSRLPSAAIDALVDDVTATYGTLNGVHGPLTEAEDFARAWAARHGCGTSVKFRMRAHAATRVAATDAVPGELRQAGVADTALVRRWIHAYVRDTGVDGSADDVAERTIARGSVYLWFDADTPRTMAAYGRVTATGCAIYGVYTPPEWRRRGYATAAVASLSRLLLEGGRKFCSLYTDLANPTSNSIYAKIGYAPVRDDIEISFAS